MKNIGSGARANKKRRNQKKAAEKQAAVKEDDGFNTVRTRFQKNQFLRLFSAEKTQKFVDFTFKILNSSHFLTEKL